tara:strand:- start:197 stop:1024 length:828 start_codon:yes stop_codon:yes gene_type:complete
MVIKSEDISVIICNRNSLFYLKKSIPVYKNVNLKEIVVIDGNSDDGSVEYLKKQKVNFFSDEGKGLSYSRYMGVMKSKGNFIFMAGPDDICDVNFFNKLCLEFISSSYDAATILLKINQTKTYWDNCLNMWFGYIRKIGDSKVIGTPTLFKRNVFEKIKYNADTIGCDDTDISEQLNKNKYKIGVINVYCNQANNNKLVDIEKKFKLYGVSDANYYKYNRKRFNFLNLINTYLHPTKHLFNFLSYIFKKKEIKIVPFAFLVTFQRYVGLIKRIFV